MGVEGGGAGLPNWVGDLVARVKVEVPELGAGWFAISVEEHDVLAGEDGDGRFSKEDVAVMVTEQADTQHVVVKVGHDVPGGCGELGEEEIT